MKSIGSNTQALFATRQFCMANLFSFSLFTGGTLNYCSGDADILLSTSATGVDVASYWANQTFGCGGNSGVGPYFDREQNKFKAHWKVGVEVDTIQFDCIPGTSQVQNAGFLSAVRKGVFDGAELTVYGAYWPQQTWRNPVVPTGTIIKFVGRVAEVDCGRSFATFTVNSHLELLNQNMPRNLWQQGCVNTLFDASCGLTKSAYAVAGSASAGSTGGVINATLANATGYFDLGTITFTGGVNSGISRTVKSYTAGGPGTLSLIAPFPNAPAAGDSFNAYPGCNKLSATCATKFNNLGNFRGFPFVPENTTAI